MKFHLLFVFLSVFNFSLHADYAIDSLLQILDKEMELHPKYIAEKNSDISRLRNLYEKETDLNKKIALNDSIYREFQYYQYDSAFYYLNQKKELASRQNNSYLITDTEIEEVHLFINYGLYWDAAHSIYETESLAMDSIQTNYLYKHKINLYYYMHKYMGNDDNKERYHKLFRKNLNELLARTHDINKLSWDIQFYYYLDNNKIEDLKKLIEKAASAIDRAPFRKRFYSFLSSLQAEVAEREGNTNQQIYYLILATISDNRWAVSNSKASILLAEELLKAGDINRAQKYISFGVNNTIASKSIINKAIVCEIVSDINNGYLSANREQEKALISFISLICVLMLILAFTVWMLIKEMRKQKKTQQELLINHDQQISMNKRLNELNKMLSQNNHIKEEYIGIFLGMRPYYIDKMEVYRKQIIKYLKAGKISELHEFCKSGKQEEDESELHYQEFDKMFLNIIPSFIDEFNNLLQEEARIYPKAGELTIELRIFALIRLGIKDSAQIAKYLRYSVNTIYNYRSRMKNKSIIPRDGFEKEIMKIGS